MITLHPSIVVWRGTCSRRLQVALRILTSNAVQRSCRLMHIAIQQVQCCHVRKQFLDKIQYLHTTLWHKNKLISEPTQLIVCLCLCTQFGINCKYTLANSNFSWHSFISKPQDHNCHLNSFMIQTTSGKTDFLVGTVLFNHLSNYKHTIS